MLLGIDFDGVLCKRTKFPRDPDFSNDPPMEGALDAINWIISQGHEPYVFTARSNWNEQKMVRDWLKKNGFPELLVTNRKRSNTKIYLDDRAVRFTNWLDFVKYLG